MHLATKQQTCHPQVLAAALQLPTSEPEKVNLPEATQEMIVHEHLEPTNHGNKSNPTDTTNRV
jgi:hypothetical protein